MSASVLPLWAEITIAALVLCGAAIALLGSVGLLRLPSFFERVHAPAMIATLGCWCIMHGAVLYFSVRGGGVAVHLLLIAVFIAITVPITTLILARTDLFRRRQRSDPNMPTPLGLRPNNPSENSVPPETE